ncbi:MAG: hypothetical protein IPK16_23685 [Anaerolineales bacterium]|nr:hypothetical protein [Anaerolineales bacterium]
MPLNATGLNASVEAAGDDVTDIHLNASTWRRLAQAQQTRLPAPAASSRHQPFERATAQHRHGGHAALDGYDHSGLLFNLGATCTGLRPFVSAPSTVVAGQTVIVCSRRRNQGTHTPLTRPW